LQIINNTFPDAERSFFELAINFILIEAQLERRLINHSEYERHIVGGGGNGV
jgi:hypothetical protein